MYFQFIDSVTRRTDRDVASGDFQGRLNSAECIKYYLRNLKPKQNLPVNYWRDYVFKNLCDINIPACKITIDDMKASLARRADLDGFITQNGDDVRRVKTPRQNGGNSKY